VTIERARVALYAAGVVAAAALIAASLLLMRHGYVVGTAVAAALPPSLLFGFIGLASRYPCQAMPLRTTSFSRILAAHLGAAAAASGMWVLMWKAWLPIVGGPAVDFSMIFALGALLYVAMVTVHYLILEVEASKQAEEAALRYEVLMREAQLKAFKAQIDPHFLFNSLNAVASLCGSRPSDAREMAQLMADFFRQTLRLGALERITLGQEIDLISRYVAIEKVRFGERLAFRMQIDDAARDRPVPPLLLQPLVENAVRHGIASVVEGGTIELSASVADGVLRISIENPADADRPSAPGEGIGLQNARGRLSAISSGRAVFRAGESSGRFRVDIELPT
jgi:two-component system, LytTR family, sensor histidine kinase AlgZ